jgi:ankyrin repeat protein
METKMRNKAPLYILAVALLAAGNLAAATPDNRLADAAKNRDQKTVQLLLAHRGRLDVNAADSEGMTALLWATHWDDLQTVKSLLAAGANVKVANNFDGSTPLHEASTFGDTEMMGLLLKAGADANAVRGEGDTPLMVAARTGLPDAVKLLLDHGAKVDAREQTFGETPLMAAVAGNYSAATKVLIDHGADVNAISTVFSVRHRPNIDATHRVDPATGGLTALHFAARQNAIDAARLLIAAGADVNKTEPELHFTPLLEAVVNNHYDFATLLIENGANVKDGSLYAIMEMRTGVHIDRLLPPNFEKDSLRVAELLIDHGADVNASYDGKLPDQFYYTVVAGGATPLFKAAETADLPAMKMLIAKGARAIPLKDGTTPLMELAQLGSRENVVASTPPPESVLNETIQLCIKLGFDVNATTIRGDTALHFAAQNGNDSFIQYLVKQGAKVDIANKNGLTPLKLAQGKRGKGDEVGINGSDVPPLESTVALIEKIQSSNAASR